MRLNILKILLILTVFISCKEMDRGNFRVMKLYQYQLWVSDLDRIDLKDSVIFYVDSIQVNGGSEFFFKTDLDSDAVIFTYSIIHDSLIYESTYCEVLDVVSLSYNGQKISLYRSHYDEQNISDEESYIFWNHKHGVVGLYNYSMGPLLLFENSEMPNFANKTLYEYVTRIEKNKRIKQ